MTEPTRDTKLAFIQRLADALRALPGITRGVFVVTLAQGCEESGYGTTDTATQANNCFGQIADLGDHDTRHIDRCTFPTWEQRKDGTIEHVDRVFWVYPDLTASAAEHVDYITGVSGLEPYQARPLPDDPRDMAAWLVTPPRAYATDHDYVTNLCRVIDEWHLDDYWTPDAPSADPIELQRQTDAATTIAPKETTVGAITAMSAVARQIIDLNTGYGQDARWSFWPGSGSIRSGQMCDCSSAETAIVILGGYRLAYDAGLCTANLGQALLDSGDFEQVAYDPKETLPEGRIVIAPGHHVVHSMGGGWVLSASASERGTATGGQPGNQNGREVAMIPQYDMTQGGTRAAYAYQPKASATVASAASSSAPVAAPAMSDLPTIHRDSSGDAVKAWTHFLHSRYSYARTVADGASWFGADTDAATRSFQRRCGLTVDGVVGPKTWAAAAREGFTR